jgi:hypothetical protein
MSNLNDILSRIQKDMETYIKENDYNTLHFCTTPLFTTKSVRFTLMFSDTKEPLVTFHSVIPVSFLMLMEKEDASKMVLESFVPIINNIEKIDKSLEQDNVNKVSLSN